MAVNPLAVGGGVVVAAAAIGGGVYASGALSSSSNKDGSSIRSEEPKLVSIKEAKEYKDSPEKEKFGGKFAYYFLSKSDNAKNKKTGEDRLTSLKANEASLTNTDLKGLKTETSADKLREKCQSFYDKTETEYIKAEDDAKGKEVGTYCSIVGSRPTTLKEAVSNVTSIQDASTEKGYGESQESSPTKLGESLKDKVISTYDPANTEFGKIRDVEFKAGGLDGNAAPANTSFFNRTSLGNKTIQTLCRDAYKEDKTTGSATNNKPTEEEVKKYCTLTGK